MEKPVLIPADQIDLTKLQEICQQYIDFVDDPDQWHEDNDFSHYIYESALETMFGKDVWKFINSKLT